MNVFENLKFGDKVKSVTGQCGVLLDYDEEREIACVAFEDGTIESHINSDGTVYSIYEEGFPVIEDSPYKVIGKWSE